MRTHREVSIRKSILNEKIAKLDYELVNNPNKIAYKDEEKQYILDMMSVELKTLRWVLEHIGIEPIKYKL